jgi:hypothetical protein|tara:strand:+ start:17618 stop:18202 length:585 start_codon:yes stop_codon:yes gene_type:complete
MSTEQEKIEAVLGPAVKSIIDAAMKSKDSTDLERSLQLQVMIGQLTQRMTTIEELLSAPKTKKTAKKTTVKATEAEPVAEDTAAATVTAQASKKKKTATFPNALQWFRTQYKDDESFREKYGTPYADQVAANDKVKAAKTDQTKISAEAGVVYQLVKGNNKEQYDLYLKSYTTAKTKAAEDEKTPPLETDEDSD